MAANKVLTAQVLTVTAQLLGGESRSVLRSNQSRVVYELNSDNLYTFEVLEFENGLIAVEGSTTNDWYFEDRDCIEPCGNAVTESVCETGEVCTWSTEVLLASVEGSIREFGEGSVPAKYLSLVGR